MVQTAPWPIPKDENVVVIKREHKPTPTHAEYEEECKSQSSYESNTDSSDESDDEDVALHKAARRKAVRQMSDCGSDLPAFSRLFDSWKSGSEKPLFYDLRNVMLKAITRNHISIVLYMLQGGYPISAWDVVHVTRLHRFELLETILDGEWWDINQRQRTLWPSILRYVFFIMTLILDSTMENISATNTRKNLYLLETVDPMLTIAFYLARLWRMRCVSSGC